MSVTVTVNGEARELPAETTIADLLAMLGAGATGIAVACNDAVVRRGAYAQHRIAPGDRIEIIKAVAGG